MQRQRRCQVKVPDQTEAKSSADKRLNARYAGRQQQHVPLPSQEHEQDDMPPQMRTFGGRSSISSGAGESSSDPCTSDSDASEGSCSNSEGQYQYMPRRPHNRGQDGLSPRRRTIGGHSAISRRVEKSNSDDQWEAKSGGNERSSSSNGAQRQQVPRQGREHGRDDLPRVRKFGRSTHKDTKQSNPDQTNSSPEGRVREKWSSDMRQQHVHRSTATETHEQDDFTRMRTLGRRSQNKAEYEPKRARTQQQKIRRSTRNEQDGFVRRRRRKIEVSESDSYASERTLELSTSEGDGSDFEEVKSQDKRKRNDAKANPLTHGTFVNQTYEFNVCSC